jgi:hypothetical protein
VGPRDTTEIYQVLRKFLCRYMPDAQQSRVSPLGPPSPGWLLDSHSEPPSFVKIQIFPLSSSSSSLLPPLSTRPMAFTCITKRSPVNRADPNGYNVQACLPSCPCNASGHARKLQSVWQHQCPEGWVHCAREVWRLRNALSVSKSGESILYPGCVSPW